MLCLPTCLGHSDQRTIRLDPFCPYKNGTIWVDPHCPLRYILSIFIERTNDIEKLCRGQYGLTQISLSKFLPIFHEMFVHALYLKDFLKILNQC